MKPFKIQNKYHKESVIERIQRDLRALVVYEMEDGEEEGFNISSKAYEGLFGEDALDSYYEQRREHLDKRNEKYRYLEKLPEFE